MLLGTYVSVGNNVTIKKCDIENSIIMEGAKIDAKIHLADSIMAHFVPPRNAVKIRVDTGPWTARKFVLASR